MTPTLPERALYALAFRAEQDPRARRVLIAIVRAMFHAVAFDRRRGGTRLLAVARTAAIRYGKWRAPVLRDRLGVDVTDLRDLARIQDWEDRAFGVTGHWTEKTRTRATKCETACPFASAASAAPELCSDVIHALETATFQELNRGYRLLPLESLLSKGAARCEFRHELG